MYPKLRNLLLRIKPFDAKPTDLVFKQMSGDIYNSTALSYVWLGEKRGSEKEQQDQNPGIIVQLVEDGAISCYLPPYNTRHTFITLQARAGVDVVMLAGVCSTGVDVIMKHYLEHDVTAAPLDI